MTASLDTDRIKELRETATIRLAKEVESSGVLGARAYRMEIRSNELLALLDRISELEAAITTVLADGESQHPGGWGPDVTMCGVLQRALRGKG